MEDTTHHRWSGWPGAYCMKCGIEDSLEYAIANDYYNPYTGVWDTDEHKEEYSDKPCSVSNKQWYDHLVEKLGKEHADIFFPDGIPSE